MKHWKRNLGVVLGMLAVLTFCGRAVYYASHATGTYTEKAGGVPVYDWDLVPKVNAATGVGPRNFPYGVYNGCSGGLVASAGIATGTAVAPCDVTQLHGCIAQAGTNITPVPGDQSNCQITTFGIITVVGTASATVTVTGVKIIMATAGAAGATQKWVGY